MHHYGLLVFLAAWLMRVFALCGSVASDGIRMPKSSFKSFILMGENLKFLSHLYIKTVI